MIKELNYKIDLPSKGSWDTYFKEYHSFIEFAFRKIEGGEITGITLPLAFCIRHTLELGFKTKLLELEKISNIKSNIKFTGKGAHMVYELYIKFNEQVEGIFSMFEINKDIVEQYNEMNKELKKLTLTFHKLDEFSYSFRYPEKPMLKDSTITPEKNFIFKQDFDEQDSINFFEIKNLFEKCEGLLLHTTDIILNELKKR